MKKLLLSIFCLFFGQSALACSDLLDSEMRILDSAESQNLCEYEGKTLLVVNVVIHINIPVFSLYMKSIKKKIL